MNDLAAVAQAATQLPLDHADPLAAQVAALQAAVREQRTYYMANLAPGQGPSAPSTEHPSGAHQRFEADGTITDVKTDGTEKPAARIARGIAADLADKALMAKWIQQPSRATTSPWF